MKIRGVIAVPPTPFSNSDEVAHDKIRSNINSLCKTDVTGFLICGSFGEFALLSSEERTAIFDTARSSIPRDKIMMICCPGISTAETIRQAKEAGKIGADFVVVLTPYYYTKEFSPPAVMIRHFKQVADESPLPVLVYHYPKCTGIELDLNTIVKIAEHPNVVGIKDTTFAINLAAHLMSLVPPRFNYMSGILSTFLPSLHIGGSGGILAVAAFAPVECCELFRLFETGDQAGAKSLLQRLLKLEREITGKFGIGGVKAAMDAQNLYGGATRMPLSTPSIEDCKQIKGLLETLNIQKID